MPTKRRVSAGGGDRYGDLLRALGKVRLEGRSLVELFTEIPDASMYPDYREVVPHPISLAEIRKRVRSHAYTSDDALISDFDLMADNAKAYNGDESPVYDDATDILDFVLLYFHREISKQSRERLQIVILQELEAYKLKGRKLSDSFMVEPDVQLYPSYLDVVKHPTSFTKVHQQLEKDGPAPNWSSFRDLVGEIFTNAMAYNQEGSPIYNDAKTLLKQLDSKINKYSQIPKHLSSQLQDSSAAKQGSAKSSDDDGDDDEDDDDEMEDDDEEDVDEPEVAAPRFDDDDDEDFEADSEDIDEEDIVDGQEDGDDAAPNGGDGRGEVPVIPGVGPVPPQFMNVMPIYDEIVYRQPDESVSDALLQMVTCHSTPIPPHIAVNLPIEDVKRAENDTFQLRIEPSPTKVFNTYATTLPYYQSTLRLSITPNSQVHPLVVSVLINGAKLNPLPAITPDQGYENYELSLAPGLNQVTIAAIKSTYEGFVRPLGPPPLADAEPDEERLVMFLNLSK